MPVCNTATKNVCIFVASCQEMSEMKHAVVPLCQDMPHTLFALSVLTQRGEHCPWGLPLCAFCLHGARANVVSRVTQIHGSR